MTRNQEVFLTSCGLLQSVEGQAVQPLQQPLTLLFHLVLGFPGIHIAPPNRIHLDLSPTRQ